MAEHRYVDELESQLLGYAMVFPDVENHILERNIYGVDINEESVEIARLSLWLRTAKKGRKLTSLSSNIKVGNSLIDDPEVAGELAFNWQEQFPTVFEKGGFDVVIGNPPYVRLESIKEVSDQLSSLKYETYHRRGDLYALFVEKGFQILQESGVFSYIMPNKWLQAGYGKGLRSLFLKNRLDRLIDFGDLQIFEGATTYPCIFLSRKDSPVQQVPIAVLTEASELDFEHHISLQTEVFETKSFGEDTWVITSPKEQDFLSKLNGRFESLSHLIQGKVNYGIKSGLSDAFLVSIETKEALIKMDSNSSTFLFPFLQGRDVKPYVAPKAENFLLLLQKGFTQSQIGKVPESEAWVWFCNTYPAIADWLAPFEARGKKRTDKGDYWWEVRACDYYDEFEKPKIMYQAFQVKPCFVYDKSGLYCNNSMWIIPAEHSGLAGVLNSKMGWWLISKYCTQIQNGYQLIWKYFGEIPVPSKESIVVLNDVVDLMIEKNYTLDKTTQSFVELLQSKFPIDKPSKKLQNWSELDFKGFLAELKKAKVQLSLEEEAEWLTYFNKKKTEANALQAEIDRIDKQIDQMVYALYGLTEEEIAIVENA